MNLINWITEHQQRTVCIVLGIIALVLFIKSIIRMQHTPVQQTTIESNEPKPNLPMSWLKLYAGVLGNACIYYRYAPGTPTMNKENLEYGCIDIISIRLEYSLQTSQCILDDLTSKQVRLLCTTVYKEHEKREIATSQSTELN